MSKKIVVIASLFACVPGYIQTAQVEFKKTAAEKEKECYTPLIAAIEKGDVNEVQSLLKQRADPNGVHPLLRPICVAAEEGESEIVKLLLSHKAYIDTRGLFGTALHVAHCRHNIKTLEILHAAYKDPEVQKDIKKVKESEKLSWELEQRHAATPSSLPLTSALSASTTLSTVEKVKNKGKSHDYFN
jgi:hypothetical protein